MAKGDLDIRMLVEVARDDFSDYFHVVARPVKWVYRDYESDRGWRVDSGFDWGEPHLSNFQVRAQGDIASDEPPYAWSFEYHQVYRVTLEDARKMASTLGKVQRGLDKLTGEFGWPESFGQYIARVASALGIKSFGFHPPRGEPMWASGERVRWDNAAHLDSQIRQRIEELRAANVAR